MGHLRGTNRSVEGHSCTSSPITSREIKLCSPALHLDSSTSHRWHPQWACNLPETDAHFPGIPPLSLLLLSKEPWGSWICKELQVEPPARRRKKQQQHGDIEGKTEGWHTDKMWNSILKSAWMSNKDFVLMKRDFCAF